MTSLDNRIRVYRAEYRMSQAELAEKIGVTRKTISTIEVGRFVPSTIIALKIAKYFGVPVEDIFKLQDDDTPTVSGT
ncbi:helix-turn-helix transcriptional regulator [Kordiimonas lipolytica]|uniref:Helix-turn-helix transcriptional regulator n=1 Tax=Kordiimonas lipolytica TaxID=1662421 RepID=A0ABV8UBD1_9PROT|nr:helix-turn-helix transcriptional regulator [Kordiimonas lipolytica]